MPNTVQVDNEADIHAAAMAMIDKYGTDALDIATGMVASLRGSGNSSQFRLWVSVAWEVNDMVGGRKVA